MAIFSRRTIQRLINEDAEFLAKDLLRHYVDELNRASEDSLKVEWELALLNAFNKVGKVATLFRRDSDKLQTASSLHVLSKNLTLSIGITVISDRVLEEENPVEALQDSLMKIVTGRGLRANSFSLKVGATHPRTYSREQPFRLSLPPESKFVEVVFNDKFNEFLDRIIQHPQESHTHWVIDVNVDILITYDPQERYASANYPSYKRITSLLQNEIYKALEEVVMNYPEGAGRPLTIILCDGGSEFFRSRSNWDSYSINDVIRSFQKNFPDINVLTLYVEQHFGYQSYREIVGQLYKASFSRETDYELAELLNKIGTLLPEAQRSAINALHFLKSRNPHEGSSFIGGFTVSDKEIKISARTLLELLAGEISQDEFFKAHHFVHTEGELYPPFNPFFRHLKAGRLIAATTIEVSEKEEDDDWIIIRFGNPDPAVSPFTVPPDAPNNQ